MTKKVVFVLVVLGVLLLAVIALHILSIFYPFTPFGLKEEQYKALVSDVVIVFAFAFALVPLFQVSQNTKKLRQELKEAKEQFQKEHGIQSFPIQEKGKDDLDWMLPHYQKATRLTIFAGSFDWLGDKPELKSRILKLASEGKLDLVSYKDRKGIEEAFRAKDQEKLFQTLRGRFRFKSKLQDVIFTIVQKTATDWELLYKSRPDDAGHAFNACVLNDTDRSRELLHILTELSKAEHWGNSNDNSRLSEQI